MSSTKHVNKFGAIFWRDGAMGLHREDGPAVIYPNGKEWWYLNGKLFTTPEDMPLKLYIQYAKWNANK
jgi:hypothetical protein